MGHRPPRVRRRQRRVVDLAPRRVVHGRVRHRQPAARHSDRAQRDPQRPRPRRSRSRRRATTGSAALPAATGSSRFGADRSPRRRHRGGRLRRDRVRRPDRVAHGAPTSGVRRGSRCSTRTTRATGAASRAPPCRRPASGSCSAAGAPGASFSATSANVKRAPRYFLFFPATVRRCACTWTATAAAPASQILRGVIYADQAGQPGATCSRAASRRRHAGRPRRVGRPLPALHGRPQARLVLARDPDRASSTTWRATRGVRGRLAALQHRRVRRRAGQSLRPADHRRPVDRDPRPWGSERMVPTARSCKKPHFAARRQCGWRGNAL